MTVAELAEATGLHHNTAREHLDRLIAGGFVNREPEVRNSRGRPRQLYSLGQSPSDPRVQKLVAEALRRAEQVRRLLPAPDGSGSTRSAARTTPSTSERNDALADQLDLLDDHLDRCGIDADVERVEDSTQVQLRRCPYSTLAKVHPQVCQAHLTLVQDVLQRVAGPLEAQSIHPFETEDHCELHLSVARDRSD